MDPYIDKNNRPRPVFDFTKFSGDPFSLFIGMTLLRGSFLITKNGQYRFVLNAPIVYGSALLGLRDFLNVGSLQQYKNGKREYLRFVVQSKEQLIKVIIPIFRGMLQHGLNAKFEEWATGLIRSQKVKLPSWVPGDQPKRATPQNYQRAYKEPEEPKRPWIGLPGDY